MPNCTFVMLVSNHCPRLPLIHRVCHPCAPGFGLVPSAAPAIRSLAPACGLTGGVPPPHPILPGACTTRRNSYSLHPNPTSLNDLSPSFISLGLILYTVFVYVPSESRSKMSNSARERDNPRRGASPARPASRPSGAASTPARPRACAAHSATCPATIPQRISRGRAPLRRGWRRC